MIVLSSKSAEELNDQLKRFGIMYDIVWMYATNSRHYAYIVPDRPVKITKKKSNANKTKSLEELEDKLNKE